MPGLIEELEIGEWSCLEVCSEDHNIVASLKVRRDGHPEDIARLKNEKRIKSSKWFFCLSDHQFSDRGAQPAKRGFLADAWQSILHPLEQRIATSKVVDHANGKPAHDDGAQNDNDGL